MYIENINGPQDVKKLTVEEMGTLADEMRHALLIRASKHGGHFGPNFGMVEAIIAMHYVFDSPKDKIVFDVSHQCYPHKMLTGRKDAYLYEEHYDDVSGYTNPDESEHDFFTVGHTSTSISLACGLAKTPHIQQTAAGASEIRNLIPINPVDGSPYSATDAANVRRFQQKLESLGVNATVRRRLGSEISAACGQLRRDEMNGKV